MVLGALVDHGTPVLELLNPFWNRSPGKPLRLIVDRIDEWILALKEIIRPGNSETELYLSNALEYVAEVMTSRAQQRLLERANAPSDADQDFILAHIVWRTPTITTDDLTPEAAHRVIALYCHQDGEPNLRSPGRMATERFVEKVVLPYAETIRNEPVAREAIELILRDAGERHNRRYLPPWKLR